jgi:ribonuclease HI
MYFDGSLMKKGAGVGLVFISPLDVLMMYVVCIHFPALNNVAEYKVLINGLRITIELGIRPLEIRGSSELVVDQVMKESSCLSTKMATYCQEVRQLDDGFDGLELNHILRWLNEAADMLAKMASSRKPITIGIFACDQYKPFVHYEEQERVGDEPLAKGSGAHQSPAPSDPEVIELDEEPVVKPDPLTDWRMLYLNYFLREVLSTDKRRADGCTTHQVLHHHRGGSLQMEPHQDPSAMYPDRTRETTAE